MKKILEFVIDFWPLLGPLAYEITARLWPTRWNISILDNVWKLINTLIPNKRTSDFREKGMGTNSRGELVNTIRVKTERHILRALLILCLFSSCELIAQPSYYMRQLRFATGVQNATDTAQVSGNKGFVWYDFTTNRYRANFGGTNKFFGESLPDATTASNGLTEVGNDIRLGGNFIGTGNLTRLNLGNLTNNELAITAGGVAIGDPAQISLKINDEDLGSPFFEIKGTASVGTINSSFTMQDATAKMQAINGAQNASLNFNSPLMTTLFTDNRTTKTGLQYSADYSATFTERSLADYGNVWKTKGTTNIVGQNWIKLDGTDEAIIGFGNPSFSVTAGNYVDFTSTSLFIGHTTGTSNTEFDISNNSITINGAAPATFAGIRYLADYSPSFTTRSLIDKAYADTKIDGTMVANRVPFGSDANTLTTDADFTYTAGGTLTLGIVGTSSLVFTDAQSITGSNHAGSVTFGYSSAGTTNGGDLVFSAGNVTDVGAATGGNLTFNSGGQSTNNTTAGSFNFNIGHRSGTGTAGKFIIQSPSSAEGNDFFMLSQFAGGVDDPIVNFRQDAVSTTDATVTTINTIAIPASTTVLIEATIVARRTGGTAGTAEDGAGYKIAAVFKNAAGTATLIGAVGAIFTAESQAGWDATIVGSGSNALIRVTGALNNNVSWHLSECKIIPVSTL